MTQLLISILTAVLLALGLGGPTSGGGAPPVDPGPPATMVGTPLVSWGQDRFPDIRDNPQLPMGPRLITTEAERDQLLSSKPLGPDLSVVADVDLETAVIVVAGYHSCTEVGAVWTDGARVWWAARPAAGSEHTDCGWAPFTVDITAVPRSAFSGEPALSPAP